MKPLPAPIFWHAVFRTLWRANEAHDRRWHARPSNDNRPGAVSGLHGLPTVSHVKSLMDLSTTVNSPAQYVPKRNNCEASMNPRFPDADHLWLILLCSVLVFWIVAGALVVEAWS